MNYKFFISNNEQDTQKLAKKIIIQINPPIIFALRGKIGTGKTVFVKGLVKSISNNKKIIVQSPSFGLAKTYATTPQIHHIDLYRVKDHLLLENLGINELIFDNNSYICIEWPEHYFDKLPNNIITIEFMQINETIRKIKIIPQMKINLNNIYL